MKKITKQLIEANLAIEKFEIEFKKNMKRYCKNRHKFKNPAGLTLMQIQHQVAQECGFRNWTDMFAKENIEKRYWLCAELTKE